MWFGILSEDWSMKKVHFTPNGETRIWGLLSSIAPMTRNIPSRFTNLDGFLNPHGFANPIALGFAIAMINGFRIVFSHAASRFCSDFYFFSRNRYNKRLQISISPSR